MRAFRLTRYELIGAAIGVASVALNLVLDFNEGKAAPTWPTLIGQFVGGVLGGVLLGWLAGLWNK